MVEKSHLEDLPDEILIEICLYLDIFDILYSFGRLNHRLQCTINEFRCELNLNFLSLNEFQRFESPYLLNFICEGLTKISLSNEYAPGQIEFFEKILGNESFKMKLPLLKSIVLGEFTNDNISILPKILYLQELDIEFSSYQKLTNQTEDLINLYIFSTENNLKKVNLYNDDGIKIKSQNKINIQIEEMSIQLDIMDDLLILFKILPNLIRLEVDVIHHSPLIPIPTDKIAKYLKEFYFHTRDKDIIPFRTMLIPLIVNIPSIEYLSFGLKTNDSDYADSLLWLDLTNSMLNLKTFIIGLEISITTDLIIRFDIDTNEELKEAVFNSFSQNCPSFPLSIYTNTQTLFIDSIPYRFNRNQSYTTSPEVVRALNTDTIASQQSPHRIVGLSITGEHVPFILNDYLNVIQRFHRIKWIYLDGINILDIKQEEDLISKIPLKLKYLKSLFYMRSTVCKINRTLFDKLFYNHQRLDTLKIMYGDFIYLLRSASIQINGNHIKYLSLLCGGADGTIRLLDLNYLISTFPFLQYLGIEITSSKLIKKNQIQIINQLIKSFKQLRSFRIVSQRGYLSFVLFLMENQLNQVKWLSSIHALGSILILQPKSLTLWKSHCQTTYF